MYIYMNVGGVWLRFGATEFLLAAAAETSATLRSHSVVLLTDCHLKCIIYTVRIEQNDRID